MQVITLNTLLHNLKNRTLTLSRTARSFYDSVYNYCMFKWTFGSNTSPFFYTILMLSENVAYVARLLKKGRGEGRGSECDIGKKKLSIVLPPLPAPFTICQRRLINPQFKLKIKGPPPPPKKRIIFLPPWLSQLLALFMITILNNNEYLGVFPWNTLSRRNSGCRTYFRPKPEEKVRVKYNLIFLTQYSRVPCRFLLFYYWLLAKYISNAHMLHKPSSRLQILLLWSHTLSDIHSAAGISERVSISFQWLPPVTPPCPHSTFKSNSLDCFADHCPPKLAFGKNYVSKANIAATCSPIKLETKFERYETVRSIHWHASRS